MRILMIRHGDPDYEHDSLTENGKIEAQLLAERMKREKADDFYVSPLGRARRTAAPSLAGLEADACVLDWLEEFPAKLDVSTDPFLQEAFPDTRRDENGNYKPRIVWDQMPATWRNEPGYYDLEGWKDMPPARNSDMAWCYQRVCTGLDRLLEQYGYVRYGGLYRTAQGTNRTIALFCHYGVSCVMLSHLWGVSPFVLWGSLVMAPSSVTELYSEEREKGIVQFRASKVGDTSHLYAGGRKPSFSARFCSVYENTQERH